MEYAKDEVFNITYATTLNRVSVDTTKWTSKVKKFLRTNKFILFITSMFIVFSIVDVVLINCFMNLLRSL